MKNETLKPCPFCGQKHTTITESNTEGVRIRCPHCNITFTRDFYEHRGELGRQRTIEAWNTRPDMSELEYLNGPWSNAACVGYCYKAMLRAGASPDTIRAVLRKLEGCYDDYSVEEAAEIAKGV